MAIEDVDLTGTTFGGFEVITLIGRGGMGLVYRARQVNLDRDVALKILAPDLAANKKFITRFVREARAAGRLSHPNIVQGIDVGSIDGRYFFAMELVPGKTLLEQLRATGPIDESTAIGVMRRVADALGHAAHHGIVHRDIKPDNILMDAEGEPKLADLGLAKVETSAEVETDEHGAPRSGVMATGGSQGVVLGTPAYISPEQAAGKKSVDHRSDLYSLGMSMYHLLTGTLPFAATSKVEMLAMHFDAPMPDVRELAPEVSAGMAALLKKLGEKDPDERPQTAEEVLEALDAVESGAAMPWETHEGIERRRRQITRRKRKRAMSQGGIALAAVVGILLVAMVGWPSGDERRRKPRKRKRPRPAATSVQTPTTSSPETSTPPVDVPERPPVKPVETPFQTKLREALEAAQQYEVDHPTDYAGAIERYRDAMGPENTVSTQAAKRRIAALQRALATAAAAAIAKVRATIVQDLSAERFATAWNAFAALPEPVQVSAEGVELRGRLESAAADAFDSIRASIDSAQRESDWAAVRDALTPVLQWGVPDVVSEAQRMLDAVKNLEAGYEAMKAESYELGAAFRLVGAVPERLATRDPAGARRLLAGAKRAWQTARAKELVADETAAVRDVEALVAAVLGAGAIARGTPFTLGNVDGKITTIARGHVGLSLKHGSTKRDLASLSASDYLVLAKILLEKGAKAPKTPKTPQTPTGDAWAGWVVLAAAAGDTAGATAVVEGREFDGDTGLRLQMRLRGARTLAQEVIAAQLLDEAEAAVQAKRGDAAAELLERFESECRQTEMMLGSRLRRRDIRRGADRLADRGGRELPGRDD